MVWRGFVRDWGCTCKSNLKKEIMNTLSSLDEFKVLKLPAKKSSLGSLAVKRLFHLQTGAIPQTSRGWNPHRLDRLTTVCKTSSSELLHSHFSTWPKKNSLLCLFVQGHLASGEAAVCLRKPKGGQHFIRFLIVCWQLIKCSESKWMCYLNTAAVSVQRLNSAAILNPRLKFPSEMEIRESHLTCTFYFTPCPMFNNAEVGTVIYQLYFCFWGKIVNYFFFRTLQLHVKLGLPSVLPCAFFLCVAMMYFFLTCSCSDSCKSFLLCLITLITRHLCFSCFPRSLHSAEVLSFIPFWYFPDNLP